MPELKLLNLLTLDNTAYELMINGVYVLSGGMVTLLK